MSNKKDFGRRYVWSSDDFASWVRDQCKEMNAENIDIGPADITHKLFHDVIQPHGIKMSPPIMKKRGRKKLPRKLIF